MTAPAVKKKGHPVQTASLVVISLVQTGAAAWMYQSPTTNEKLTGIGVGALGLSAVINLAIAIAIGRRR